MKELKLKIEEFLKYSNTPADFEKNGWDDISVKMNEQKRLIEELKVLARAQKTYLGRIIEFPCADSSAMYIITKVNKRTVQLTWVDYCDAWVDDRCGKLCNIDYRYASNYIKDKDYMEANYKKAFTH